MNEKWFGRYKGSKVASSPASRAPAATFCGGTKTNHLSVNGTKYHSVVQKVRRSAAALKVCLGKIEWNMSRSVPRRIGKETLVYVGGSWIFIQFITNRSCAPITPPLLFHGGATSETEWMMIMRVYKIKIIQFHPRLLQQKPNFFLIYRNVTAL